MAHEPRRKLPMVCVIVHLVVIALFFWLYESSRDPNRGLLFVFLLPIDPVALLATALDIPFNINSDAVAFGSLVIVGTAQWYLIGLGIDRLWRSIVNERPFMRGELSQSEESQAEAPPNPGGGHPQSN